MTGHLEELRETGHGASGDRGDGLVKDDALDLCRMHLDPISYAKSVGGRSEKFGALGSRLDEMDQPLARASEDESGEPAARSDIEKRTAGNERQKLQRVGDMAILYRNDRRGRNEILTLILFNDQSFQELQSIGCFT